MCKNDKFGKLEEARERWEKTLLRQSLKETGEHRKEFRTKSGIPIKNLYTPLDLKDWDYIDKLGFPGEFPFVRGISPTMYRDNPWITYQYAGFGSAEDTNKWFKYLIDQGARGLAIAMDLPTQIGYDSDHPLARGEVGKQGVSVDSLADMEAILNGIPLEGISTNVAANSIGPVYLAWIIAVAEKQCIDLRKVEVNMQNEPLKEFAVRGTYIFPPKPSIKFANDAVEYTIKNSFKASSHPICYCGYHFSEAGATVDQELAFTLANAVAYMEELVGRGIKIDEFGRRVNVFIGSGVDFFESICKHRAFRRMWAKTLEKRFSAKDRDSLALYYRCYTQGSEFTAQQPLNNIARGTIGALAAALAGVQTLTVTSMDEALALPSPEAVRVALRTQQIIAEESGIINTPDPLGGSYFVEALTDEIEERATRLFEQVQSMGGAPVAISQGFYDSEVAKSAYQYLKQIQNGERVVVGVNKYVSEEPLPIQIMRVNPEVEERQIEKLNKLRRERDSASVKASLNRLKEAAQEGVNLVTPLVETVKTYATLGEIRSVLQEVFGEYKGRVF